VSGRSLSEIADALGLGYKTIANTCTQIKTKLGVNRTAELVRVALEAGIC
jgi:DNA-binding CsgD family transcriptional regulator